MSVDVELGVRDGDMMGIHSVFEDTVNVVFEGEAEFGLAEDTDGVIYRGGVELANAAAGGVFDAVEGFEFLDDFVEDGLHFGGGFFVGSGEDGVVKFAADLDVFDVAVRNSDDIGVIEVFDLGALETNASDFAFGAGALEFDDVADVEEIVGEDVFAHDDVGEGVFESEADDHADYAEAGDHRGDVNAENLKDGEEDDDADGVFDQASGGSDVSLAAFYGEIMAFGAAEDA